MLLVDISPQTIFLVFLTFCRIGSAIMFLPGIGEISISPLVRLLIGLTISFLIFSSLNIDINMPNSTVGLIILIGQEVTMGVAIGLATKLILSAIHVFGLTIASQSGLAAAMLFDPSQGTQGSIFGNFFTLLVITLILNMNLHLLIITGLANTYSYFPIGSFSEHFIDFTDLVIRTAATAFLTGIKMALPFLIVSLLLFLGSGILSKLMPQFQVFFVLLPAQVIVAVMVLLLTFSSLMMWFLNYYQEHLNNLFGS